MWVKTKNGDLFNLATAAGVEVLGKSLRLLGAYPATTDDSGYFSLGSYMTHEQAVAACDLIWENIRHGTGYVDLSAVAGR